MILRYLKNLTRDIIFETIGRVYHFYIYLKQDRRYFRDLACGIDHSKVLYETLPLTDKICIFVLFQHEEIPNHVLVQLDWINKLGYSTHIISNLPITQQSINKLKQYSFKVTERPNIGYDFGAYQYGVKDFLKSYGSNATRLMLMNDSIFFPLLDPRELYEKVDQRDNDFWGWTENWEIHYHLTSYGIVFKTSAFRKKIFSEFWYNYKPYSNRQYAINSGEVKLTETLLKSGLQPDTAIRTLDLINKSDSMLRSELHKLLYLLSDNISTLIGLDKKEIRRLDKLLCTELLANTIDKYSPTHYGFLIINQTLNFPILKKDMIYKNIFLQGKLLANLKLDESIGITLNEIDSFYRKRGRLIDQRGNLFKRVLAARGYH